MIWAFAIKWFGWLPKVKREVWYGLAAALAFWWLWNTAESAGEARERAKWEQVAREAAERAREADSAATGAIEATRNEVEQTNDQARAAATGSDDPLAAGFDRLRNR